VLGFQGIMDRLTAVLRAVLANIWREREKITRAPFVLFRQDCECLFCNGLTVP